MKVVNPPDAEYAFGYRQFPRSGNEINGLDEEQYRQPRHVFHGNSRAGLDWGAMNNFFSLVNAFGVVWHRIMTLWAMRRSEGPVADAKTDLGKPSDATVLIKRKAVELGAVKVGVTEITESAVYEGHSVPHKNAIVVAVPMDREIMAQVPHDPAAVEVMRAYHKVAEIAMQLAVDIRSFGWSAKGYGDPESTDILHIPLAVQAGIGELGKHGSLICDEYGSNIRLATVVTDMPLALDEPIDLGVDDFCLNCRRCTTECPPAAIHDEKKIVRGQRKWYVDFDKCIPYFAKTKGCAICIQVCPWSETGRGFKISGKMLARRKP